MTNTDRHIRRNGRFIDASFKNGQIEYYVVQGSSGRFYNLDAALEIADALNRRAA